MIEVTKTDSDLLELIRCLRICAASETGNDCMDYDSEPCGYYESRPKCVDILLRQAADALTAAYTTNKGGSRT